MARNRQTAWRVEGYRQEIRDHGGPLAETRGQERTAFPDRRVFRHGGFVAGRGQAHAPQDRLMPRKQRHTARRVYARLVEEEGFQGSYSSVQRYVKRWREEHRSDGDGYLELDWRAGVMQVDFGEAVATIGGGDVRVHCLVATFPHSNMRYVAAMPGENAECVCEGPAQILDHIGMAPRVLVLDNATRRGPPRRVGQGHRGARVRHVLRPLPARDEVLQPVFRQRERVRRERGRLPAPQPHGPKPNAESHRQPARHLPSRCDAIADVDHYRSGRPIHELFDEERGEMQPLPRAFRRGRMSRAQGRQGGQHPDRLGPLPRGPVMARLDAARRPARVRGGDPHRRRQAREHPSPLLRERRPDGQEPRHAAARACPQTQRVGQVAVARRASRRARRPPRRPGSQGETTRADAPAQGRRGERVRERGPGHDGDRGGRQDPGRGQPARTGQTDRAGRPARPGRRAIQWINSITEPKQHTQTLDNV